MIAGRSLGNWLLEAMIGSGAVLLLSLGVQPLSLAVLGHGIATLWHIAVASVSAQDSRLRGDPVRPGIMALREDRT